MNSSGIKRGLAVSAISALALAGIPALATPASAVPLANQQGTGVDILTTNGNVDGVSPKPDGTNSTISIAANGGPEVTSVQFQYRPSTVGATAVNIGGPVARNADGLFVVEWDGNAGVGVTAVDIIAIAGPGGATDTETAVPLRSNADADTVELGTEGTRGFFDSPYAADGASIFVGVNGTTSQTTGNILFEALFPGAIGANAGTTPVIAPPAGGTTGTFAGRLDIQGYPFSPGAEANQLAIRARTGDVARRTDDVEASTLRSQTITSATATPARTNAPAGSPTNVTVVVNDEFGQPIAGALVNYTTPDGVDANTDPEPSGVANVRTDGLGRATFSVQPGTYTFFVETDAAANGFTPGDVVATPTVVITSFAPAVRTVDIINNRNRANFDVDELSDGDDFRIVTQDQFGNGFDENLAGADIEYRYVIDPTAAGQDTQTSNFIPAETDADGNFVVPALTDAVYQSAVFPNTGVADQLPDGSYTIEARRPNVNGSGLVNATAETFAVAESEITYTAGSPAQASANGTYTSTGRLALTTGAPLAGRRINITYAPGGDSSIAPQAQQPAGVTVTGNTATTTTGADGQFSVVLTDPAVPANVTPASEEGTVNAEAFEAALPDATPLQGDNGATDSAVPNAPANAEQNQTVVFAVNQAPARTTVTITPLTEPTPGKPGRAVTGGNVTVLQDADNNPNTAGTPVAGISVTLTVSKGFFTDGTNDPAAATGADAGELRSLGTTITRVTNSAGQFENPFSVAIERDVDFDDDGLAEAIITATVGTGATAPTDTEDVDFDSANPLNGGEVQLVLSPANEQDGTTDPAGLNQRVAFDVYTTDQFGNRVGGEAVRLTEDGARADLSSEFVFSDFDDDGDATVSSDRAESVTVTGTWNAPFTEFGPAPAFTEVPGRRNLVDTLNVQFEGADLSNSDITVVTTPSEGAVALGTTVTETVTVVDQNGRPVPGLQVEFVRSGAGGGDTESDVTDANGVASYSFVASTAGTVNFVINITDGTGQSETRTDSVVVNGTPPVGPNEPEVLEVQARVGQANNGRTDIFRVVKAVSNEGDVANGARVTLFKKVNGRNVRVRTAVKTLNSFGRVTFRIADVNKRQLTLYFAKIARTSDTPAGQSPVKKVR